MNLEEYQLQFKGILDPVPKVSLLGIRGFYDQQNPFDIYNDLIVSCINGTISEFQASVDPGSYYMNHPLNPQGCARLQCGLWYYQIGEHHTKMALVQNEEVKVDRIDKDGKKVSEDSGYLGINLHSGGPEYLVGRYSAGCQVIKTDEPWLGSWLSFFLPISNSMEDYEQKRIPYLLIDKIKEAV